MNVYGLFRARWNTDTIALRSPDGFTCTYGELDEQSARVAHVLVEAGVVPGDRVAVQTAKSPMSVALYLACLRAGAVYLPMNTAYTDAEVQYFLGDSEPTVAVFDPNAAHATTARCFTLDASGHGSLTDASNLAPIAHDVVSRSTDDLACLMYTSGTTGRPKGAQLSHGNLAANALALNQMWHWQPDDVLVHSLPIFHVHGLFVALNGSFVNGSTTVLLPSFDPGTVVDALEGATVFMGVPTHYTRLLADARFTRARCAGMRLFTSGSAPLLAATHVEFRDRTGFEIVERYGMTETLIITSNPLDSARKPGSVGIPLPGMQVKLDGEDVLVSGPSVLSGYWNRPEINDTEFTADGYFKTGDVGRIDEDGYLHLVGRSKDLVISGGLNVYPIEVETVLDAIDGVLESAVIGVPDADFGEAVTAVVVLRPGATTDEATIRAIARKELATFKVPKRVHIVADLPRNTMGKVEKATLRRTYAP